MAALPDLWRVAVTEGSMAPAILPGDWLVVNRRVTRWPATGRVVVFREPLSETLAIKRVAAGPGEQVRFGGGYLTLAPDEAWLTKVVVDTTAGELTYDLAIDASGAGQPSVIDAGFAPFGVDPIPRPPVALYLLLVAAAVVAVPLLLARNPGRVAGRTPRASA